MKKPCQNCQANFEITDDDLGFYDRVSPMFAGKKYALPEPKLCPDCRLQRRLSFRNERILYKRKCDLSGESVVSAYNEDIPIKVFDDDLWYGDDWDAMDFSVNLDLSKSFSEQFSDLYSKVPRISLMNQSSENSEYANYAYKNKDSYMIFGSHYNEDSFYGSYYYKTKNCLDCLEVLESELVYEGNYCSDCYDCRFIEYCFNSNNCYYCYDLIGCKNCLFSSNLRNKEYYIFNKAYSKEEYFEFFNKINFGSFEETKKNLAQFEELKEKSIHKSSFQKNCEDSFGDDVQNSKNLYCSFNTKYAEDCSYIYGQGTNMKDCIDCAYIGYDQCESIYECIGNSGNNSCICLNACWHNNNIHYSEQCFGCSDCFGCIGLKHKKYCILNVQYSKEEYEDLVQKIINLMIKEGTWGMFFDPSISLFGYNETLAQEYFPLTKEQALSKGFAWSDYEMPLPKVEKIIPANLLPDMIGEVPDDILNWAVMCELSGKPFRIIKQELDFYRQMNIAIPHLHPDERHKLRMAKRNPRKLFDRTCDKCSKEIQTSYSPDRPEVVYCEQCYLDAVY